MRGRPAAKRTVHDQRRPVHAVCPAEDAGGDAEQPRQPIVFQLVRASIAQTHRRERADDDAKHAFDNRFGDRPQQQQAERNAGRAREHQPHGDRHLHVSPVLGDDNRGDGNRNHHRNRRGGLDGQGERQERDGNQRLAKAECRAHERRAEQDGDDVQRQRTGDHDDQRIRREQDRRRRWRDTTMAGANWSRIRFRGRPA